MDLQATPSARLSLNARAGELADVMIRDAARLRVGLARSPQGATFIDCGHRHPGSHEAGLRLAAICMGGLAEASLVPSRSGPLPWTVMVRTSQPWLACLASQYAGWHLDGPHGLPLMGSGPARVLARRESLFDEITHREDPGRAVLVLEGEVPPTPRLAQDAAEACGVTPERMTVLHARTGSLAGMVQIAARVLECAVQKARLMGFDLSRLSDAIGTAPVGVVHPDTRIAMGRANDAIIYGGQVHLFVTGPARSAKELAEGLPSRTSADWGQGFSDVYDAAGHDFARIDGGFFSPAEVAVTALDSGDTFRAGTSDPARLSGATGAPSP
ncbi:methenyltetrahydromethanopterin cyclohydrolase [Rubellimicrobium arenae]|uniref:methenyltetrahydromethanopterin cyclohydrolase n=1 Tax=Rubellimicrobium arenae TaxID=2817372 RepID=UPI001B30A451|nr:methenyltetrahydromethanopterin cyclohydrolase [Rubellimicrobium arenae]